jgi:DNA polymerase-3 subunit alpha
MAVLALEDFSSRIEVVVFPQAYNEYHTLLREDIVVEVEGRFNVDERGSKIIASRMALLEEGKPPVLAEQGRNMRRGNGYGNGLSNGYGRGNGNGGGYNGENENYYDNGYYADSEETAASGFVNEDLNAYDAPLQQNDSEPLDQNRAVSYQSRSRFESQNVAAVSDRVSSSTNAGTLTRQDDQGHIRVPVSAIIELVISPERESEIVTKALIAILQKHHGSTMVFLKLMGSRRRIRLDPRYYVNGQDMALQDELKELLGENAFRVKEI